ncbi:MAG: phosphodiester glycosidase family protein [Clostridia bacterium]|nr:phosphodiester glycosidase family protein [Clostridia bacterium]
MQNKRSSLPKPPRQLAPGLIALIDILLIGVSLVVFALFDHVIPRPSQKAAFAVPSRTPLSAEVQATPNGAPAEATPLPTQTDAPPQTAAVGDFSEKFADKFTAGEVIQTNASYQSANLNVTLTRHETTVNNRKEVYFVEDIYIRHIDCLRTVFAKDTFGRSMYEDVISMSERTGAVAAINSDYYGAGNAGIVIRNGVLYRREFELDEEVLIIFRDGTMKTYQGEADLDLDQAMAEGAWQSFSFGPSLLDENGDVFASYTGVNPRNHEPRTLIGMIEPGHYVFVVVDGRRESYSAGMSFSECASLCKELGCAVAYNLDGGQTSQMTFLGGMANSPYKNGRTTSDMVCIVDVDA